MIPSLLIAQLITEVCEGKTDLRPENVREYMWVIEASRWVSGKESAC